MGQVEVVTEALRGEAKKWDGLSDQMETVTANIGGLTLDASAFWCGDPLTMAAQPIYAGFQEFVKARCAEGATEFQEIGDALRRAADAYDGTDTVSAATLKSIYSPGQ